MELRQNEYCPIHRSHRCCGREQTQCVRRIQPGIRRFEDPHPRRYRELRSPAEMRKLLKQKVAEQKGICAICHEEFTDYNDIVPDHRDPKGMGGAWRDDHPTIRTTSKRGGEQTACRVRLRRAWQLIKVLKGPRCHHLSVPHQICSYRG